MIRPAPTRAKGRGFGVPTVKIFRFCAAVPPCEATDLPDRAQLWQAGGAGMPGASELPDRVEGTQWHMPTSFT